MDTKPFMKRGGKSEYYFTKGNKHANRANKDFMKKKEWEKRRARKMAGVLFE